MIIDKFTRTQFCCEVCCVFFCASESSTEKAFLCCLTLKKKRTLCCVVSNGCCLWLLTWAQRGGGSRRWGATSLLGVKIIRARNDDTIFHTTSDQHWAAELRCPVLGNLSPGKTHAQKSPKFILIIWSKFVHHHKSV